MLLVIFSTLLTFSSGARILGIIPMPSYSHQITFWPIWKELSLKGHNVTTVTTDPMNDPTLENLTEISIRELYDLWRPIFGKIKSVNNPLFFNKLIRHDLLAVTKFILDHKDVASLKKNENQFDLVLVEAIYPEFLIFGTIFGCPTVLISSLDVLNEIHGPLGNAVHPITNPDYLLPYFKDLDFKARLISTVHFGLEWLFGYGYMSDRTKIIREYFGDDMPDVNQMLDQVAMLFLNIHPALHGTRLTGPNTIQFGGMVHMREPQPLPKDLQTYLDKSAEGVVYFSLGTNVLSQDLTTDEFDAIVQALGELPYKVLWKYELDNVPHKPKNIKFVKWLPQQDILRHPNIKVFVTQGGLQSLEEAIYCHVPVVVLPFVGDQIQNAKKVEHRQIGKAIYHTSRGLNKNELKNAILEVIEDPSYRKNIKALAEVILDEPMTGVKKVIWWTEYVIRHRGAKHFRNHSLDIPLYQYLMLDTLAFLIVTLIVLSILVIVACRITRYLFSIVIGCFKVKKE